MPVDISEYKVGVILSVEEQSRGGNSKALKICQVDVGSDEPLCVVTTAPNVRDGSRVAVAVVGSTVRTETGDELTIEKTVVGGNTSQGILCDSKMLGWAGGASGIAVQIPESFAVGSAPPAEKPRPSGGEASSSEIPPAGPGLFEKKMTKEEKKKLAEQRKAARKAKKEAAKQAE